MSDELFREALAKLIDDANAGVTHEEFAAGVPAGTMGFKCMSGEPYQFVRGGRLYIFYGFVLAYLLAPWIAIPLWAWHEGNWWLLGGIAASITGTVIAGSLGRKKEKQGSIAAVLLIVFAASWFFLGIHNYWTFYSGTTLWGLIFFMIAEQA